MTPPSKPPPPNLKALDALIKASLAHPDKANIERSEFDQLSQNVEKLAEDVGQVAYSRDSIKDYINSLTDDIKAGRNMRFWLCLLAVGMILVGLTALMAIIFCPLGQADLKSIRDSHVQIAVIVALFGLTFGLTALLIKGAFQRGQSEAADIMPEHVKLFIETIRGK